jgi:hypothetical protein
MENERIIIGSERDDMKLERMILGYERRLMECERDFRSCDLKLTECERELWACERKERYCELKSWKDERKLMKSENKVLEQERTLMTREKSHGSRRRASGSFIRSCVRIIVAYTTFKGQVLISVNTLCLSEIISIFLFLILDVSTVDKEAVEDFSLKRVLAYRV